MNISKIESLLDQTVKNYTVDGVTTMTVSDSIALAQAYATLEIAKALRQGSE